MLLLCKPLSLSELSFLPCSSTANKHFLRSMAHVGAGCVEFFDPKTKSKWERKVKAQLDKAFQPALTSVQVQWKQVDDDAPKPIQVGTSPPFLPHRQLSACSHSIFVHTLLLFSLPLPLFLDMLSSTPYLYSLGSSPPPPPPPTGPPGTHVSLQWVSTGGVRVCPSLQASSSPGKNRRQRSGDDGVHHGPGDDQGKGQWGHRGQ